MPRKPSKTFVIKRPEQLEAMSSPVRSRLVELLSRSGPQSVRELAGRMGRSPESLYHHVKMLLTVGLIKEKERRKAARRPQSVYELVAPRLLSDPEQCSGAYAQAFARSAASLMRLASRDFARALESGAAVREGPSRNLAMRRYSLRLTAGQLAELNRALDHLDELLHEAMDRKEGDAYALTTVLVPLEERGKPPSRQS